MSEKGHPGGHPGGKTGGHPGVKPKAGMPTALAGFDMETLTDTREKGAERDGAEQRLDKRLFMQLICFGECTDTASLIKELEASGIEAVLYADVSDARGVGLLTMSEDPEFFVTKLRDFLNASGFAALKPRPKFTMFGRTYAIGFEKNLEDWLLKRSRRVSRTEEWPWAVWYPLRRSGEFALLSKKEQGSILMEHGVIGRAFGEADLGHDIRLVSYGMDRNDNDFTIALIGKDLHPLSVLVQTMRRTKQTSTYIEKMGPFFVGRVIYYKPYK